MRFSAVINIPVSIIEGARALCRLRREFSHARPGGVLVCKPERVDLGVDDPFFWHVVLREDRRDGTGGFAGPAVDALIGVDVEDAILGVGVSPK